MASIDNLLNRYRPQPQRQEIGIGGFTAIARVKDTYTLGADVPESAVEDGSFINDHIILKPLTLDIEGNAGDVHLRPSPILRHYTRARAEIGNLANLYAPGFTSSQLQEVDALANSAADALRRVDAILEGGEQALDYFGNRDTETKSVQEQFVEHIEALHFGRQITSIDMPFRRHDSMVITAFTTTRNNETQGLDFKLTARKIRIADLRFIEQGEPAGGTNGQTEGEANKGAQEGEDVERSLLSFLFSGD